VRHLSQANPLRQDFLVVDTEGSGELSEIAIFDHRGKLIYEAFTQGHSNNTGIRQNLKTLQEIATDVTVLAGGVRANAHVSS
jgi:putative heme degradation protein